MIPLEYWMKHPSEYVKVTQDVDNEVNKLVARVQELEAALSMLLRAADYYSAETPNAMEAQRNHARNTLYKETP